MQDHQLLYLVYGPDEFYIEARFSVVSALLRSRNRAKLNIVVHCERPARFADLPVRTEGITAEELRQWAGPQRYHHRCKPCVLRRAIPAAQKTALIDTDTFFLQEPETLFDRIDDATLLIDEVEQNWREVDDGRLYQALNPYLQSYPVDDQMPFVNSGVIGITIGNGQLIDDAIDLIDQVYLPSGKLRTLEQIAIGVVAYQRCRFREQEGIFKHYWSRKSLYRSKIDAFLERHRDDLLSDAAQADLTLITPSHPKPGLPARLRYKASVLHYPPSQRHFLVELRYGSHRYTNPFDRASRQAWWERAFVGWTEKHGGSKRELDRLLASGVIENVLGDDFAAFEEFARSLPD